MSLIIVRVHTASMFLRVYIWHFIFKLCFHPLVIYIMGSMARKRNFSRSNVSQSLKICMTGCGVVIFVLIGVAAVANWLQVAKVYTTIACTLHKRQHSLSLYRHLKIYFVTDANNITTVRYKTLLLLLLGLIFYGKVFA